MHARLVIGIMTYHRSSPDQTSAHKTFTGSQLWWFTQLEWRKAHNLKHVFKFCRFRGASRPLSCKRKAAAAAFRLMQQLVLSTRGYDHNQFYLVIPWWGYCYNLYREYSFYILTGFIYWHFPPCVCCDNRVVIRSIFISMAWQRYRSIALPVSNVSKLVPRFVPCPSLLCQWAVDGWQDQYLKR